ncbi:unnamed protein product [Mytilus edulis]|uniref:Integrase catalytic domain-containing protein n=1 Tax=Mytilus edulis TaxID=6550 RepID=A0A8S3T4N0_MYTED|nr:unnamed protein product [Mytilus edulis]
MKVRLQIASEDAGMYVKLNVGDIAAKFVVDTGATLTLGSIGCYRVVASEAVAIPPRSEIVIKGTVCLAEGQKLPADNALLEANEHAGKDYILTARTLVRSGEKVPVRLMNTELDPKTIYPGTTIAQMSGVDQVLDGNISSNKQKHDGLRPDLQDLSTTVTEFHRKVLSKGELLEEIQKNHKTDHRKSDTVYETLRKSFFPVVRENIRLLFKLNIKCQQCLSAVDLPKTQRTRRPIPATYPNSRWQMDLKKMPPSHGYNYICNIVDCYSRFAFGGCIKHKTAKEVATVILRFIYIFGPPRILQTDNGKEFNNEDLTEVMAEFKTRKINGRPYHPQSQGRVERFNRTVVAYFRTAFVDSRDWPSMLDEFYYKYNSRVNKSTKPLTPYQRFYKRPNFCVALEDQVPICNLTSEEKAFLNSAHLDVEDNVETEELTVENTEVNENSQGIKMIVMQCNSRNNTNESEYSIAVI